MAAQDYTSVVQQLYISYFGRPADYFGLKNFTQQLDAMGAPKTFAELAAAVQAAPGGALAQLVGNFANSEESTALYGNDNSQLGISKFVTAIYKNFLNREPDLEGYNFWVNAIVSGGLNKANAAAAITAGALANTTEQGQKDALTVQNKLSVATSFTDALDTPSEFNAYAGDTAAAAARGLLQGVTDTTNLAAYQSTIEATVGSIVTGSQIGATTQLTKGLDNLTGTSGNDVFVGSISAAANSELNTLSSLDQINGGAGIDTLRILTDGTAGTVTTPQLTSVEIIDAQSSAGLTLDASGATGVTNLNVTKANGVVAATAAAATDVAVTLAAAAGTVSVNGGNNVNVTLTDLAAGRDVTIGATTHAKGDVVVNATGKAYAATDAAMTMGNITVNGGKTISVTQHASSSTAAVASDLTAIAVTEGNVIANGDLSTTAVTITNDAAITAANARYTTGGTIETSSVKFTALTAGQSVTIDGLTFTAKVALTAAEVAGAFASITEDDLLTQAGGVASKGTYSGELTGDWVSADASGDTVVFTYTGNPGNVTDLVATGATATATNGSANNATATGGRVGVVAGTATINDVGTITTATVNGYSTGSIATGGTVLSTLNLSNGGNFATGHTASTLDLNLEKVWTTASKAASSSASAVAAVAATITLGTDVKTLNVTSTGANAANLSAAAATALNVDGTGTLTATGSTLTAVKAITVTESAGLNLGSAALAALESVNTTGTTGTTTMTIDGTKVSYAGGAGVDNVTISATASGTAAKSIDLGAGDDTLNLSNVSSSKLAALADTVTLSGGEGTDTLVLTAEAASTLSATTTFGARIDGFEKLAVGVATGTVNVNLANLDNINYVISNGSGGVAAATPLTAVTSTQGVAAQAEKAVVSFGALAAGQSFTLAGVTVTAVANGLGLSASDVAILFGNGVNASNANYDVSGFSNVTQHLANGWTLSEANGTQVTFTSTQQGGGNVTDLDVTTTGGPALPSIVTIDGVDAKTESYTIQFHDLTAGQSYTVGGLTVTASTAVTAADVATVFDGGTVAGLTTSGTLTGYGSDFALNSTDTLVFTSTTEGANVTDLASSASQGSLSGSLVLDKVAAGATLELAGAGSVTVNLADASGTSDVLNVVTNSTAFDLGTVTANKVETINFNAIDSDVRTTIAVSTNLVTLAADAAKTINVSGAGNFDLVLGATTKAVTLIDASTATGDVALSSSSAADAAAVTINGGSGDDYLVSLGNKADKLVGGEGNDTLVAGKGLATLTGGEGHDTFVISVASDTVNTYSTVTDFAAGDLLQFGSYTGQNGGFVAATSFNSTVVTLGETAVFQDYANATVAALTAGQVGWFQFNGNTYVVADMGTDSTTTFVNNQDFIVKLTGLVDLSAASFNSDLGTIGLV